MKMANNPAQNVPLKNKSVRLYSGMQVVRSAGLSREARASVAIQAKSWWEAGLTSESTAA